MRLRRRFTIKLIVCYALVLLFLAWSRPSTAFLLAGLPLIVLGEIVRCWATGHLRKNEAVITSGPYSYVRDPMYLGTLLVLNGFCLASRVYEMLIVIWLAFSVYYMPYKQRREGQRLSAKFGRAYDEYRRQVASLIPRLTPYQGADAGTAWSKRVFLDNHEIGTAVAIAVFYLLLVVKNVFFRDCIHPAWTLF